MPGTSWEWLTCLMIIFWGGLAEPFRSLMPYLVPEEMLEDYIYLALNLSGSAFRVELAAESAPEPAPFREPTESAPEPAPFREPTESAPELALFCELTESTPFREPTEYAPDPGLVREPTESAPEPAPVGEPTESAPEPALVREPTESAYKAREPAALSAHGPPALPAPPWHPCLPLSPGPLPLNGPGPPHPSSYSAPLCRSPCWALGNVWKPFLKGGVMS